MKFVLIVGPPAVGKMTVGQALAEQTGLKLFHNHMSLELINQFFDFGTPPLRRLDTLIRFEIFKEVAKSDLKGLIFTLVWDFNDPEDEEYVDEIIAIFKNEGAAIHLVELEAELAERLIRNKHPHRLSHKPSKRDVEASEKRLLNNENIHRMNSREGEFPNKPIFKINNTKLSPQEAAQKIIDHYHLD